MFVATLTVNIQQISAQQYNSVSQCWEDSYSPASSQLPATGADVVLYQTLTLCTTGTGTLPDGRAEIVTRWHSPSGISCTPVLQDSEHWTRQYPHEAVARRVVATQDNTALTKQIFWVGGKQTRINDGATSWEALVLPYRYISGTVYPPTTDMVYTFGDDSERNHEVVAMSSIDSTSQYGPLAIALIQFSAHGISPPSSAIVALRPVWNGTDLSIEEVLFHPLAWVATDVHAEYRTVGQQEVIRLWAIGNSPPGWRPAIRVALVNLSLSEPDATQYAFSLGGHHLASSRFVLGPGEGNEPDLFIVGTATPTTPGGSPSQIITLRFGKTFAGWDFRWHELYASDGDAVGADIAAVLGPTIVGPGSPPGPDTYIFVAGRSQRQIGSNPPVFTNDFTTLCYKQGPLFGTVNLHWAAKLDPQDGDDRAFRILGGTENRETLGNAVAIVLGVTENASGHWDWRMVKYDDAEALPPALKQPVWDIKYPFFHASAGEDAPAALTGYRTQWGWDFQYLWVAGTTFDEASGFGMTTVNYEQGQ
jgi:hypothetical protein